MTECGEECVDGTPCENNAESCPWHGDEPAPDGGRDFSISEDDHDAILEAARNGVSETGCARAAGVTSWAQLDRYLDAHPEFRSAFVRARNEGERTLVEGGLRDDDMDSQHARFLLSTSFDYVKTERREVEHSDDSDTDGIKFVYEDE